MAAGKLRAAFGADMTPADAAAFTAGLAVTLCPLAGASPRAVLAAVETGRADAALLAFDRAAGALAALARALWEADLFVIRELAGGRALLLAREPAPAVGAMCAVGGTAATAALPEISAVFVREGVPVRDFFSFPAFDGAPGRCNLWLNFSGSLNSPAVQRALGGFEALTRGYRFFGNF